MFLWVIWKILGLFVNPLAAYSKRQFMATFSDAIIWETKNNFSFFFVFSKSRFNFGNFLKKYDPHSACIFELTDSEKPI